MSLIYYFQFTKVNITSGIERFECNIYKVARKSCNCLIDS